MPSKLKSITDLNPEIMQRKSVADLVARYKGKNSFIGYHPDVGKYQDYFYHSNVFLPCDAYPCHPERSTAE